MNRFLQRSFGIMMAFAFVPFAFGASAEPATSAETPWKVHQTSNAVFPTRLILAGVTHGEARIRLSLTANGQLSDALVTACTHREFGEEALRTVKQWRFDAPRVNGEPVGVVGDIFFEFNVNGPIAIEKRMPAPAGPREEDLADYAYKAEGTKRLDAIPTPAHVVPPVYPKEWATRGITGRATVEFFIDENGAARVPVATVAAHPLLAAAAVAAVGQWRFEPPKCGGKPALVKVQQDFNFQPEP